MGTRTDGPISSSLVLRQVVLVSVLYKEELFAENVEVVEHKKHHVVHMHMHNEYLRDREELQKRHEDGDHNLTYTEDDFEDDQYCREPCTHHFCHQSPAQTPNSARARSSALPDI